MPLETLVDWPSPPTRGVVEGFYGQPFDAGGRAALLYEMAEARQNTYVYGPQNDEEAHGDWFELYDDETLAELGESAGIARDLDIDFAWAVRPGQGVFYLLHLADRAASTPTSGASPPRSRRFGAGRRAHVRVVLRPQTDERRPHRKTSRPTTRWPPRRSAS